MILKDIEWRNFKSYSNIPTVLQFDSSKPSVNLIVGDNGAGKSSVSEVIKYSLYGKLDNFTSSDIPNRVNKNFYSRINIECEGHDIVIERGLAPSLFGVTLDGERVDTAGKTNVQSMLEDVYFRMSSSVFNNTLVLSISDFKPLIDMGAADKRNIMDKIFGFTVFNQMLKLVKEELKVVSSNISVNEGEIRANNSNISQYTRQIEEIRENDIPQSEIDELMEKIKEVEESERKNNEIISKLEDVRKQLNGELSEHGRSFQEYSLKIKEIDKRVALIDSGKCPTCGANLTTEDFQQEKTRLLAEKEQYIGFQKNLQELGQSVKSKINAIDKKESQTRDTIRRSNLMDLKSDLRYKTSMKGKHTEPLVKLKNELNSKITQLNEEREGLLKEQEILKMMCMVLGEDGIKKYITSRFTPIINQIMVDTLSSMNLNYEVEFDDNFNGKIVQNGYNIKYSTLSTGEKKKIDFACVVSIIKFLKISHGDMNVLFIDELFSNVDHNTVGYMIGILKNLADELKLNIFLIHHAPLEGVMFDHIYRAHKPDGFSRFEEIEM